MKFTDNLNEEVECLNKRGTFLTDKNEDYHTVYYGEIVECYESIS